MGRVAGQGAIFLAGRLSLHGIDDDDPVSAVGSHRGQLRGQRELGAATPGQSRQLDLGMEPFAPTVTVVRWRQRAPAETTMVLGKVRPRVGFRQAVEETSVGRRSLEHAHRRCVPV